MIRVVIVDDDSEIHSGLAHFFPWAENGFEVCGCFASSRSALDYLLIHPVDLLITDICMPGLDGLDLIRELQTRNVYPQIILLSAYKNFQYAQKAMQYGVRYYLVKPAAYGEIMETLESVKKDLYGKEKNPVNNPRKAAGLNAKIIARINAFVTEHYKTVTLQELSEMTHMNASYLSRFYKENTGQTLSSFIISLKMKQALRLLRDPAIRNIYEISEDLGYTNAKSFSKAFKGFYGLTPQEYRNSFRDEGGGR